MDFDEFPGIRLEFTQTASLQEDLCRLLDRALQTGGTVAELRWIAAEEDPARSVHLPESTLLCPAMLSERSSRILHIYIHLLLNYPSY